MIRVAPIALLLVALSTPAAFAQLGFLGGIQQDHLDTETSLWELWEGRMEGPAGAQLVGSSFTVRTAFKAAGITTTVHSALDGEPMYDLSVVGDSAELTGAFDAGIAPPVTPPTINHAPAAASLSTDGTEYIQPSTFTCQRPGSALIAYKATITFKEEIDWYGIIDSLVSDDTRSQTREIRLSIWVTCVDEGGEKKKPVYRTSPLWGYGIYDSYPSSGLGYLDSLHFAYSDAEHALGCARNGEGTCDKPSTELGKTWLKRVDGCGDEQEQDRLVKRALSRHQTGSER